MGAFSLACRGCVRTAAVRYLAFMVCRPAVFRAAPHFLVLLLFLDPVTEVSSGTFVAIDVEAAPGVRTC